VTVGEIFVFALLKLLQKYNKYKTLLSALSKTSQLHICCLFVDFQKTRDVRHEGCTATKSSCLCSTYLEEKWFDWIRLRAGAAPTVFDLPTHLQASAAKPRTTHVARSAELTSGMLSESCEVNDT